MPAPKESTTTHPWWRWPLTLIWVINALIVLTAHSWRSPLWIMWSLMAISFATSIPQVGGPKSSWPSYLYPVLAGVSGLMLILSHFLQGVP